MCMQYYSTICLKDHLQRHCLAALTKEYIWRKENTTNLFVASHLEDTYPLMRGLPIIVTRTILAPRFAYCVYLKVPRTTLGHRSSVTTNRVTTRVYQGKRKLDIPTLALLTLTLLQLVITMLFKVKNLLLIELWEGW